MIRRSHAGEAEAHFRVQHDACVAAFAHVFPPELAGSAEQRGWRPNGETRVVPFPPHPLDVGYTFRGESPAP